MTCRYDNTNGEYYTDDDDSPVASLSDIERSREYRASRELRDKIEELTTLIRNRRHAFMSNVSDDLAGEMLQQADEWCGQLRDLMKALEGRT